MFDGPFDRQVQRALGQVTDDDIECSDVDLRFALAVERVKVRRGTCCRQNIWMTIPKNWLMVGMACLLERGVQLCQLF